MLQRQDPITTPVIVIDVADIDGTLADIEAKGGSTVRAKEPVGDMGFAAYFTDTEGNLSGCGRRPPADRRGWIRRRRRHPARRRWPCVASETGMPSITDR